MQKDQKKLGVILSYLGQSVKLFAGLVYTPIVLRILGQSEYGVYQLVNSVIAYLGLLNFGFSASYVRFYSRYKVEKKKDKIAELNGMYLVIFVVLMLLTVLCGCVIFANMKAFFGTYITNSEYDVVRPLFILMLVNLAISFPNSVFDAIILANEKFIWQRVLVVAENILNPLITIPLLMNGFGAVGMAVTTTVITFIKFIINILYCEKKIETRFVLSNFDFTLFKEMWMFTFFIFINQVIDQINWSVDRYLLGRMSGSTEVAVYSLGGQINTMYLSISVAISSVFVPKVNDMVAREENSNEKLSELFIKIGRIQFMVVALVSSGFVLWGRKFICMWAGEEYSKSYYVTLLLILSVTIPLTQNIGIEILRAKNKHQIRTIVYSVIAVGNVLISIPLIKKLGAIGAAVGTAAALVSGNVCFMNWYYAKYIKLNIAGFWKSLGKVATALIIPILTGCAMIKFWNMENLIVWGTSIVIYIAVYACSIYFFAMNEQEKLTVKRLLWRK